jgi:asparagine N-glycosylation enzyme membrane subunit Stt3
MLEEKIISVCTTRHKNLSRPATIASKAPDTQVKIYNKSAYYVIKDCADITLKYLAHYVYSNLTNPVSSLKGKVSEEEIIDFVNRAHTDSQTRQLLQIILSDVTSDIKPIIQEPITDFTIEDGEDVYGDYEYTSEAPTDSSIDIIKSIVDITNDQEVIDKLKSVFLY